MSGWCRVLVVLAVLMGTGAGAGASGRGDGSAAEAFIARLRATHDAGGRPFAVVDKLRATVAVYTANGLLAGRSAVLLGLTGGDEDRPDARARLLAGTLGPDERITPAGRFETVPGRNLRGDLVVWLDYGAALALHRLRPAPLAERRAERLASSTPADNRITLGCVVVDGRFFDSVVLPVLGKGRGVVYVLPENGRTLARWLSADGAPVARPD